MHHLAAVAVVLAVAASPASAFINHNLLVPRQTDSSGPSPTNQNQLPNSQCIADMSSLTQLQPTMAPDLSDFLSEYAGNPQATQCGWYTDVPSSLSAELASYETVLSSWKIANAALLSAYTQDCLTENYNYSVDCRPITAGTGPAATPLPAAATASTSTSTTAPVTIGPTSPIITGTVPTASHPVSTSTHTTSAASPAAFAAGLGFLVSAVAAAGFLAALALL